MFSKENLPLFEAKGSRNIRIPRQLSLFDGVSKVPSMHVSMGYFYELLTTALFGGTCQNNIYLDGSDEEELTKPDVITKHNQIFESKANRSGYQLLLLDDQLERYRRLQVRRPHPEIYFVIYRHNFPRIKSYTKTEMELWRELASHTFLAVVLPLSIIHTMHDRSTMDEFDHLVKYYHSWAYQCARVRSPTVNLFFTEPERALTSLRMEIGNYTWSRFFLPRVRINGISVNQFPFILLQDRDHKTWAQEFAKEQGVEEAPF